MSKEETIKCYGDVYTLTHNPEFPVPKYEDFMEFKKTFDENEGWTEYYNKNGTTVYFRDVCYFHTQICFI